MAFPTQSADLESTSSQYFSRADTASLSITGDYTVEAWIKLESSPGAGVVYPICMKNDAGSNRSTSFLLQESGGNVLLSFGVDETGNNSDISSIDYTWNPSTGVWYHVAGVFTASTGAVEIFIDGTSVASNTGTATAIFDGNASTYIGFQGGTTRYFDGKISLVRVWSTTRTGAQLGANKCEVLGATANLAAEWTLDNVYTDNSGNSNTLTAVNSPTFTTDIPSVCSVISISVSDQLNLTESVTMLLTSFINVSDQLNLTESVSLLTILNIAVNDSITLTELASVVTDTFNISVSDQIDLTESITVFIPFFNISVSDQLTLTENISIALAVDISVSDNISISENVNVITILNISVSDQINTSEAVTMSGTLNISVSDQLNITENVTRTVSDIPTGLVYMRGQDQGLPVTMNQQEYPLGFKDQSVS